MRWSRPFIPSVVPVRAPFRTKPLAAHVEAHADGFRAGEFSALGALFDSESVLTFHGVPIKPFVGRSSIEDAFARHPPTDTLHLVGASESVSESGHAMSSGVEAPFAWDSESASVAGRHALGGSSGRIQSLEIRVSPV